MFSKENNGNNYNKQQLKDKRVELGLMNEISIPKSAYREFDLSIRDYLKSIDEQVSVRFNCKWQDANIKPKEDSKLKLTEDDVGKEFECELGNIFKIILFGKVNAVAQAKDDDGYFIINHNGSFFMMGTRLSKRLVKRHEPRWWLDKLPDADLFCKDVQYIHCLDGVWAYKKKGWSVCHEIKLINMPTLNCCDYYLSKITIEELRKYQLSKKAK